MGVYFLKMGRRLGNIHKLLRGSINMIFHTRLKGVKAMSKYYYHDYHKPHHSGKSCKKKADVEQEAVQLEYTEQDSDEMIWIKDSCNVKVQTSDTQAAVSLQVALQLAIALVISVTIGDSEQGQYVAQQLTQEIGTEQTNTQKIIINNSKDVNVTTTDTDVAVNVQALLQVLVALVAELDIF
jgi:spore coat protein X